MVCPVTGRIIPILDYQTLMRSALELHVDGTDHATKNVVAAMADRFRLTDEERAQLLWCQS